MYVFNISDNIMYPEQKGNTGRQATGSRKETKKDPESQTNGFSPISPTSFHEAWLIGHLLILKFP